MLLRFTKDVHLTVHDPDGNREYSYRVGDEIVLPDEPGRRLVAGGFAIRIPNELCIGQGYGDSRATLN